jgi:hypothetical protein
MASMTFRTDGETDPTAGCYAVTGWRRTKSGRPATNIRLGTATPVAALSVGPQSRGLAALLGIRPFMPERSGVFIQPVAGRLVIAIVDDCSLENSLLVVAGCHYVDPLKIGDSRWLVFVHGVTFE